MRNKVLILFTSLSLLSGCSKESDISDVSDRKLIGNWEWTKTEDFDPEQYHERLITPAISNSSGSLEFSADGSFAQRKNNRKIHSGIFNVYEDGKLLLMSETDTLDYNYEIASSNLILEDLSDSGVVFTYVRTRESN